MQFWTPNVAYAVGLITTDGNLLKDRRHISLTSTDLQLLRTFKKCLFLTNRICSNPSGSFTGKPGYKVTFGNVKFYDNLLKIGLMPNKTFKLSSLKIPKKYLADFLRGHIDGDGSIILYKDRHNKYKGKIYSYNRLYVTFNSGSFAHIKWIRKQIEKVLGIKGSLSGWRNPRRKNIKILWTLRFCKKESLTLLKYLYYTKGLPCLIRKRKVALLFLKPTVV